MTVNNETITFLLQDFFQTVLPSVAPFIVRRDASLGLLAMFAIVEINEL